jgi:hypothetical protein
MPNRRRACGLIGPALLLAFVAGCQGLYGARPLPVLVRDRETKRPIADAEVRVSYPLSEPPFGPSNSSAPTGPDGVARLWAAPNGDAGLALSVTAPGYISEDLSLSAAAVRALAPAHYFEAVEGRPATRVVELYAKPAPAIELVLPVGYRGVVRAELHVQEDAACPPGQRLFSGALSSSGVVTVDGPPLLRHAYLADFRGRFADGTALVTQPKDPAEVGMWLIRSSSTTDYEFFIGSQWEYDRYRNVGRAAQVLERATSGGGRGGGRGRGGRHGGASASDPTAGGTGP